MLPRVNPYRVEILFLFFFKKINVTSFEQDMSQIVDLEMLIANQKESVTDLHSLDL